MHITDVCGSRLDCVNKAAVPVYADIFYHKCLQNETGKISFPKNNSSFLLRTEQKFFADMIYGMLGSGSCLLSVFFLHGFYTKVSTTVLIAVRAADDIVQFRQITVAFGDGLCYNSTKRLQNY